MDEKLNIAIAEILLGCKPKTVTFYINDEQVTVLESKVQPIRELNWVLSKFQELNTQKSINKVENWFKTHGKSIRVSDLPHTVISKLNQFDMNVYGAIKMR